MMAAEQTSFYRQRLGMPFALFCVCLTTLLALLLTLAIQKHSANSQLAQSGVYLSLGIAVLSFASLAWFVLSLRKSYRQEIELMRKQEQTRLADISRLRDELAPLASGHLDVKATVLEGAPGILAEAFNFAIGELQRVTGAQNSVARALADTVSKSRDLVQRVRESGADQSERILEVSNKLLSVNSTINELSVSVVDTTEFAKTLAQRADSDACALRSILERAQRVNSSAELSIRLMDSQQRQWQTINQSIVALDDVNRKISMLAINANLVSSANSYSAKAAEKQHVVNQIASELSVLSAKLSQSLSHTKSLSQAVTADGPGVLESMQTFKMFMEEHIIDIDVFVRSMRDIQHDAEIVQTRVTQMVQKSARQTTVVSALGHSMQKINRISQQVLQDINENADTLGSVKKLSGELRQNLSDFNLPDSACAAREPRQMTSARRLAERAVANV